MDETPTPVDADHRTGNRLRVSFIMEQHVGLRTYGENLRRFVDRDERVEASWMPVTYAPGGGFFERLPLIGERVLGMLRGRREVRTALRGCDADVVLFLTQTPAVLGGRLRRKRPYVIMTDDTPLLYDRMSGHYNVSPKRKLIGAWRHRTNVRSLRGAAKILPMSNWARRSLLDDYGVPDHQVDVVPTGIDLDAWAPLDPADEQPTPLRVLFVGGDFHRKGGQTVLDAFRRLPAGTAELHLVTRTPMEPEAGVSVYADMQPNAAELIKLFTSSHVFVLPSLAEAFPNVVVEAAAAGLPAVLTDVGGMAEMVVEGETGHLIPPGDVDRLESILRSLIDEPQRRAAMARAARDRAEQLYDGRKNASRVVDHLLAAARSARQ